jgi:hypothetical protein
MRKTITYLRNPIRCARPAILFATTAGPAAEDLPNIVVIYAADPVVENANPPSTGRFRLG